MITLEYDHIGGWSNWLHKVMEYGGNAFLDFWKFVTLLETIDFVSELYYPLICVNEFCALVDMRSK